MKRIGIIFGAVALLSAGCHPTHEKDLAELRHRRDECDYLLSVVERRVQTLQTEFEKMQNAASAARSTNRQAFADCQRVMAELQEARRFQDVIEMRQIQLTPANVTERKAPNK